MLPGFCLAASLFSLFPAILFKSAFTAGGLTLVAGNVLSVTAQLTGDAVSDAFTATVAR